MSSIGCSAFRPFALTRGSSPQALCQPYVTQLMLIYVDMLNVYKMYSELISANIAAGGPHASKTSIVKLMRTVKKVCKAAPGWFPGSPPKVNLTLCPQVTLRLIETFVEKSEDPQGVATQFVPAMLDPILGDYARNIPDAREPEVGNDPCSLPLASNPRYRHAIPAALMCRRSVAGPFAVCRHYQQAWPHDGAACPSHF